MPSGSLAESQAERLRVLAASLGLLLTVMTSLVCVSH